VYGVAEICVAASKSSFATVGSGAVSCSERRYQTVFDDCCMHHGSSGAAVARSTSRVSSNGSESTGWAASKSSLATALSWGENVSVPAQHPAGDLDHRGR
jgi:hypothetical protein